MYKQVLDPVGNSLFLSTLFALIPIVSLFVLLGVMRLKAHWAALISLGVAIVVALAVYGMPFDQTGLSATEGQRSRTIPTHDADGETITSASANTRSNRRRSPPASSS